MSNVGTGVNEQDNHQEAIVCTGQERASPHPRVFLHMGQEGYVSCPYCGHVFLAPLPFGSEKDTPLKCV